MQSFGGMPDSKKSVASFHPHIEVGESHVHDSSLRKFLQALYPEESIHYSLEPNLKEIDTYVLFFVCAYGAEEAPLLIRGIHHAQELLDSHQLKADAHILIVLYRDLKVAFPERKLQREKVMSEMMTEEILKREAPHAKDRIRITHEFGTSHLQDTLQQLTGSYLYFEGMT